MYAVTVIPELMSVVVCVVPLALLAYRTVQSRINQICPDVKAPVPVVGVRVFPPITIHETNAVLVSLVILHNTCISGFLSKGFTQRLPVPPQTNEYICAFEAAVAPVARI